MADIYIFDSEKGEYVLNPNIVEAETRRLLQISNPEIIVDEDGIVDFGSMGSGIYPPNSFSIEQQVNNNPDGTTTVDIVVVIADAGSEFNQYEVRVSRR